MKRSVKVMLVVAAGVLSACSNNDKSSSGTASSSSKATTTSSAATASSSTAAATASTGLLLDSSAVPSYLNLVTGEVVDASGTWHLKVQRLNVEAHSDVEVGLAVAQDLFYDEQGEPLVEMFINATPETEVDALLGFVDATDVSFSPDSFRPAIAGMDGWYNYDFATHVVTAKVDNYWIIQSSLGDSYAKFHAREIVQDGQEFTTTFDFYLQASGEESFATEPSSSFTISNMAEQSCFDFDTGQTSDCAGLDWDVSMVNGEVVLNGGASGDGMAAALGPITAEEIGEYSDGSDPNLARAYSSDLLGGVIYDSPWYAYNLQENHQIWPNYRVYLIDTDITSEEDELIKLQFINYYDESGSSGNVTLRFMPLSQTEE